MVKLSVVIITYNEERNLGRCLASIKDIADEILIVDSGSTDRTQEIGRNFGARIIERPFDGYYQQKNFANDQASNEHILSLDADEELSPELKASMIEVLNNWTKDGYSFNRLTSFCGAWIHYCGWYPDRKIRLFKKGRAEWSHQNPHEKLELKDPKSHAKLSGDLLHYSFYSVEEYRKQQEKYATMWAKNAYANGRRANAFQLWYKPVFKFFRDYILLAGFLDGVNGLIICRLAAGASYLKYRTLYQLAN
ncbi:MAG: glycosyltransferase family 2 protein [Bacteroidetes bacterium]|nr:glycosyltransferase family 2 protein [Bacteroidota bacterium]